MRSLPTLQTLISLLVLTAFLALAFLPWDVWFGSGVRLADAMAPISALHPLGADNLGRDMLVRLAAAVRGAVLPLWAAVAFGCAFGVMVAMVSLVGRETRFGRSMTTVVDLVAGLAAGLPPIIVAFALAVVWQGGGLWPVTVALAVLFGLRSYLELLDWSRQDGRLGFWTAHAAMGGGHMMRLWRYGVWTSWRQPLLQSIAFHLRAAVAIEAALSYLGFGVQEPQASFGNMLSSHFDLYLKGHWQTLVIIVAALLLTSIVPTRAVRLFSTPSPRRSVFAAPSSLPVE